jgi:hypothetical protein
VSQQRLHDRRPHPDVPGPSGVLEGLFARVDRIAARVCSRAGLQHGVESLTKPVHHSMVGRWIINLHRLRMPRIGRARRLDGRMLA